MYEKGNRVSKLVETSRYYNRPTFRYFKSHIHKIIKECYTILFLVEKLEGFTPFHLQ